MAIPWFRRSLGSLHAVIVHTKTDETLRGLLVDKSREFLVLRPASIAGPDPLNTGNVIWTAVDGDVVIPRENVNYWQEGIEAQLAGLTPELFE